MKRLLVVWWLVLVPAIAGAAVSLPTRCLPLAAAPVSCTSGVEGRCYVDSSGHTLQFCLNGSWAQVTTGAGSGATTALDNLASVNINTTLLAQTGVVLGSTAHPFNNLVFNASGTYGTGSFTFAGTPTANRVVTITDGSQTLANITFNQTFAGQLTFSQLLFPNNHVINGSNVHYYFGAQDGTANQFALKTPLTPDNVPLMVGTTSESWLIFEAADEAFDFNNGNCGTSACTDPSLWIYSHNQNTAQWGGFWHDATNFNIKTGTGAVKISNHVMLAGTAPTLSSCGTSPSAVTGSDGAGHFTVGSAATTCTLTFNATWSATPECFGNDQSSILAVLVVPTTTTITFTTSTASAISSQLISYFCVQGS